MNIAAFRRCVAPACGYRAAISRSTLGERIDTRLRILQVAAVAHDACQFVEQTVAAVRRPAEQNRLAFEPRVVHQLRESHARKTEAVVVAVDEYHDVVLRRRPAADLLPQRVADRLEEIVLGQTRNAG